MSSVAKAMCCTPEPNASDRKRDDMRARDCEALSTRRSAPSAVCITWLLHEPAGIEHVLLAASSVTSSSEV